MLSTGALSSHSITLLLLTTHGQTTRVAPMRPLTRRISLLVSLFSLVIGLFLLGYNLRFISEAARATALNLWPVLLVLAGILLVVDSAKKRSFSRAADIQTLQFPIPLPPTVREVYCKVQFSYGRLVLGASPSESRLVTEQLGSVIVPSIVQESIGVVSEIAIAMSQPLFPAHFQLRNTWRLELCHAIPLRLALHLHEADLLMDLHALDVESLELKTDSGTQKILLGKPRKKLTGQIYSSSADLSVILPSLTFVHVRLLNPFCRVDYPQGDLEKREDGSLVSPPGRETQGSIEFTIDGPIRNLILDIEDQPET